MRIDQCSKKPLIIFLIAAPALIIEQTDIVCEDLMPRDICVQMNSLTPVNAEGSPGSVPHDDEEAELLALSFLRDEEQEEKPTKRKDDEQV